MKNGPFVVAGLVVLALTGCHEAAHDAEVDTTGVDTAEVDTAAIEAEVLAALDVMVAGMNEHDVAKIASVYSSDVVYVGDGISSQGIDGLTASARAFHDNPLNSDSSFQIDTATVKVLGRNHALLTAIGRSGPALEQGYTLTDLFERRAEGWVIVHEHESTSNETGEEG